MKIDLGCGARVKEGFIGLDKILGHDIEKSGIPFKEVDEIYSFHFLEHINDLPFVMEEIYKALKPNGVVEIIVPHFSNIGAFHWTHKLFFNIRGFDFVESNHPHHFYCSNIDFIIFHKSIEFSEKREYSPTIIEKLINYKKGTTRFYEQYLSNWFRAYQIRIIMRKI